MERQERAERERRLQGAAEAKTGVVTGHRVKWDSRGDHVTNWVLAKNETLVLVCAASGIRPTYDYVLVTTQRVLGVDLAGNTPRIKVAVDLAEVQKVSWSDRIRDLLTLTTNRDSVVFVLRHHQDQYLLVDAVELLQQDAKPPASQVPKIVYGFSLNGAAGDLAWVRDTGHSDEWVTGIFNARRDVAVDHIVVTNLRVVARSTKDRAEPIEIPREEIQRAVVDGDGVKGRIVIYLSGGRSVWLADLLYQRDRPALAAIIDSDTHLAAHSSMPSVDAGSGADMVDVEMGAADELDGAGDPPDREAELAPTSYGYLSRSPELDAALQAGYPAEATAVFGDILDRLRQMRVSAAAQDIDEEEAQRLNLLVDIPGSISRRTRRPLRKWIDARIAEMQQNGDIRVGVTTVGKIEPLKGWIDRLTGVELSDIEIMNDRILQGRTHHALDAQVAAAVEIDGQMFERSRTSLGDTALFGVGYALSRPRTTRVDARVAYFHVVHPQWQLVAPVPPTDVPQIRPLAARINAIAAALERTTSQSQIIRAPEHQTAGGLHDQLEQLERIQQLVTSGAITPAEAAVLRTRLLTTGSDSIS